MIDRSWVLMGIGAALLVAGGVAAVVGLRGSDDAGVPADFTVSAAAAAVAEQTAGCEHLDVLPLSPTPHLDTLEDAPSAEELYPDLRPTAGGRHLGARIHAVGVVDEPPDERVTTHNLEHGAVVVYYDPVELPVADVDLVERWGSGWNEAGFDEQGAAGGGVIVAPYDGTFTSGRALALRAWDVAVDCDRFEVPVADGFLARHFGDRGKAPEGHLVPYPAELLELVP